jgi:hypothetical protein
MTTGRTANQIKNRWYSVFAKRELKYLGTDGERATKIRLQVRNNDSTEDIIDIAWPLNSRSAASSSKKTNPKRWQPSHSGLVMSSLGKLNVNCSFFQKSSTIDTLKGCCKPVFSKSSVIGGAPFLHRVYFGGHWSSQGSAAPIDTKR